ncbi:MAG: sulfite exporter TauE/SafE family protein [Acidobacteria bacterium]|nr:sulfite exporter TauE/SafE family protein [Acidobacteriota bacterium]
MENVSLVAAFVAGLLSFVSPCVLPLVPGYLSFISGVTLEEMRAGASRDSLASRRRQVFGASLAFVLGFSLVFIALGASASAIGQFLMERLSLLGKIAGIVLILFGLHSMGVVRIGWLYAEKRVHTQKRPTGPIGALLVGVAFAFGWTPCIGPILAAILAVAAAQESIGQGVRLLAVYSLGLGVPFLLTSIAVNQFFAAFARVRRYYHAIEVASGALLVAIGVLIFTNRFTVIAQLLTPYLPTY